MQNRAVASVPLSELGRDSGTSANLASAVVRPATWRAVDDLLALIADFCASVDQPDDASLQQLVDQARSAIRAAQQPDAVASLVDACDKSCREVLRALAQRTQESREEIATLVLMVREALSEVSTGGDDFNATVAGSVERFQALADVDDIGLLKRHLIHEVSTLRTAAEERQRFWEETGAGFESKIKTLEKQLDATNQDAAIDALTHLGNRRAFDRILRDLSARAEGFALALVDFDFFKQVNDTWGHLVGDNALRSVAAALSKSVRGTGGDLVARLGGDEFAVVIPGLSVRQMMLRMRMVSSHLLATKLEGASAPVRITLSIGVSTYAAGDDIQSLLARTDEALYEAKRLGRHRVVGTSPGQAGYEVLAALGE